MASNYQGKRSAGGRRKAPGNNRGKLVLLIVLLAVVIALAAALLWLKSGGTTARQQSGQDTQSTSDAAEPQQEAEAEETEDAGLSFPYTLEEGLSIQSFFTSDLMNPDGSGELVEGLASLELTNDTEEYLSEAAVTVTLTDGIAYTFAVSDLPAGGSVIAFSTEDASYDGGTPCQEITCDASFTSEDPLLSEQVSYTVEGSTVTLTNLTDEDLNAVQVTCHDTLDSDAFGGRSYTYTLDSIPAGASAELEAEDCMLGEAQVVRITAGE